MHARARSSAIALTLLGLSACAPGVAIEGAPGEIVICGHGPTVEGIDVSSWQGGIDWNAVAGSGIQFAIVRIGDGNYHDRDFAANWNGARGAGLIRGAYQFFEPGDDPIAQADIVVAAVGRLGAGDLPVTIDVEAPSPGVSPGDYTARIHAWVDRVTAGTGRPPIVYTGRYYWDPYVASSDFTNLPLWHAQYTSASCPNINDRWGDWAFWQYTSSGSIPGIGGNVDRNRFNGTYAELQALASVALCTPHCEGSTIVDASCGHGDCAAFGSRCVDDALGARCAFFACPDVGDTTACLPDGHTIATCHDGGATTGDCAAFGSRCTAAGGPARCAFFACPDVGDTTVCLPDGHTLGTCSNGAITTGDCAAYGALCSTQSASGVVAGHCASVFCVAHAADVPVAHDTCLPDGQLVHCTGTGGLENAHACAAGSTCVETAGVGRCVDPHAPPPDAGMGNPMGGTHADAGAPTTMHVGDGGVLHGDAMPRTTTPMHPGVQMSGCSVSSGRGASATWIASLVVGLALLVRRRRR